MVVLVLMLYDFARDAGRAVSCHAIHGVGVSSGDHGPRPTCWCVVPKCTVQDDLMASVQAWVRAANDESKNETKGATVHAAGYQV